MGKSEMKKTCGGGITLHEIRKDVAILHPKTYKH
jgi:hypothetical protein